MHKCFAMQGFFCFFKCVYIRTSNIKSDHMATFFWCTTVLTLPIEFSSRYNFIKGINKNIQL